MKKSTLFISAALSVFMLAVLAGAITAYNNFSGVSQADQQLNTPIIQEVAVVSTTITPEQASQIAAAFLGRSDLYSVESSSLNGSSAYMVTFSSGEVVYVSPQGQVLALVAAPAPYSVSSSASSVQQTTTSDWHEEHENEGHDD